MKNNLIAIDLDGTLLRNDCTISSYTKKILERCISAGNLIVPCTGRSYENTRFVLQHINTFPYYINANGNTIVQGDNITPLFINTFPLEIAQTIYNTVKEYDVFLEIYHGLTAYDDEDGRNNILKSNCDVSYRTQFFHNEYYVKLVIVSIV